MRTYVVVLDRPTASSQRTVNTPRPCVHVAGVCARISTTTTTTTTVSVAIPSSDGHLPALIDGYRKKQKTKTRDFLASLALGSTGRRAFEEFISTTRVTHPERTCHDLDSSDGVHILPRSPAGSPVTRYIYITSSCMHTGWLLRMSASLFLTKLR
jgi:hypothetical protein